MTEQDVHSFVVASDNVRYQQWLQQDLREVGEIIVASPDDLDGLLGLVDMSGAGIVFVELGPQNRQAAATLIEGLQVARPGLVMVAIGDDTAPELLLTAMRAGARDFMTPAGRRSELVGLVRRLLAAGPPSVGRDAEGGHLLALFNARPTVDTALLAVELARALRRGHGEDEVLLLDLGLPQGDCADIIGAEPRFDFLDAVRNLRRLDRAYLDKALLRDEHGLRLLAMPADPGALAEVSSAQVYLLMAALRSAYSHVIAHLGGLPVADLLQIMLGASNDLVWLCDQSIPGCRHNAEARQRLQEAGVQPRAEHLVIDRYRARVPPNDRTIAEHLGVPWVASLPAADEARLQAINTGGADPRGLGGSGEPYARAVRNLAERFGLPAQSEGWLQRLCRKVARA